MDSRYNKTLRSTKVRTRRSEACSGITNKKLDPVDALQKEMEKRFTEFENRIPKNPSNGGFPNNYPQKNLNRHTALNFYSGSPPENSRLISLSSRGPNSASYGHLNNFVRPPGVNGTNHSGNFYRRPDPNPGCYRCGDSLHRARECPVAVSEHRTPPAKQ